MQHSKATVDLLRTAQDALARSGVLLVVGVACAGRCASLRLLGRMSRGQERVLEGGSVL